MDVNKRYSGQQAFQGLPEQHARFVFGFLNRSESEKRIAARLRFTGTLPTQAKTNNNFGGSQCVLCV